MALEQLFSEFTTKVRALYGIDDLSYTTLEQLFPESAALVRDFYEVKKPDEGVFCSGLVYTKQGVACSVRLKKNNEAVYTPGCLQQDIQYSIYLADVVKLEIDYDGYDMVPAHVTRGKFPLTSEKCLEHVMEAIGKAREEVTAVMNTWIADIVHGRLEHPDLQENVERCNGYYRKRKDLACNFCSRPTLTKLGMCNCRLCICCLPNYNVEVNNLGFDPLEGPCCVICGESTQASLVMVER